MNKFTKNLENTNGFAQATYKEVLELKATLCNVWSKLQEMSSQIKDATFNTLMQGADISEFFPVQTLDQLERFMDREDKDWPSRRQEFYHFLYTIASENKKGFGRGLIKALFSREFIATSGWPSYG